MALVPNFQLPFGGRSDNEAAAGHGSADYSAGEVAWRLCVIGGERRVGGDLSVYVVYIVVDDRKLCKRDGFLGNRGVPHTVKRRYGAGNTTYLYGLHTVFCRDNTVRRRSKKLGTFVLLGFQPH